MKHSLTGNFVTSICNYLIEIHIGLRAASGLPNYKRKMTVKLTRQNFRAYLFNGKKLFKDERLPTL
jgi:hypothetical protein